MKLTRIGSLLFFLSAIFPVYSQVESRISQQNANLGQALLFELVFTGSERIQVPEIPEIEHLQFQYRGESRNASVVIRNNRTIREITTSYQWLVTADEVGPFRIPSLEIRSQGKVLYSDPVSFNINEPGELEGYSLKLMSSSSLGIPGQPIESKLVFYLSGSVANLHFVIPFMNDPSWDVEPIEPDPSSQDILRITLYGVDFYGMKGSEIMDGIQYTTLTIPFYLSSKEQGIRSLDPCLLSFDEEIGRYSMFSAKYESRSLKSNSLDFNIQALPEELKNSPNGVWVSQEPLTVELKITPRELRLGDPMELEISIKGLLRPDNTDIPDLKNFFQGMDGFQFSSEKMETFVDHQGMLIVHQKLRLASDQVSSFPSQDFVYYNLADQKVHHISSAAIPIKTKEGQKISANQVEDIGIKGSEQSSLENKHQNINFGITYSPQEILKQSRFYWTEEPGNYLWMLFGIPFIFSIALIVKYRPWVLIKREKLHKYPWLDPKNAQGILDSFRQWAVSNNYADRMEFKELMVDWENHLYGQGITVEEILEEMNHKAYEWENGQ